ncbi:MAG: DNA polymerase III subunit gamma/tau [Endomicrobium sp.]|jgi:DNA polymerase-3 subunit gamma/tau|nr:DNA polymerase III subunit gamma/tau [Endomicrobium sp.]
MAYINLTKKFRPKKFSEIINQDHICQALMNSIAKEHISYAYLFSGNRGCGKTTMARVFAKTLNCKNRIINEPCNICENCIDIEKSHSLDVLEIDGASNNGVDEMRNLKNNVMLSNINSKYKIYIIDEAQQITSYAFNVLLKTLEEPPKCVVFILVTTEQYKIPITILSRCQRYRFKSISNSSIKDFLEKITKKEHLEITDEALNIIVSLSNGSIRDSLILLEQISNMKDIKITSEHIKELIGIVPNNIILVMIKSLLQKDIKMIFKIVNKIYKLGYNIIQFTKDLRDFLRKIMIYSINPRIIEIFPEEQEILKNLKIKISINTYIHINTILSKAINNMYQYDKPIVILEIYLLKATETYYNAKEFINKLDELIEKIQTSDNEYNNQFAQKHFDDTKLKHEWKMIINELGNKHPLIAMSLKNALIKITSDNFIQLTVFNQFDYDNIVDLKEEIHYLLKKKVNLNIELNIIKSDITNNYLKEIPKHIEEIATDFNSKIELPK